MKGKLSRFHNQWLAYLFVAPQVIVTLIFFIFPALYALITAFYAGDAFGIHTNFVGLENFRALFTDADYLNSIKATFVFTFFTTFISIAFAFLLAVLVEHVHSASNQAIYKTLLIWPYAVAPAIAGMLWRFVLDPSMGIITHLLNYFGYQWDYFLNPKQAMLLVVIASAWQQLSYNFIFFLAGLTAIPKSLVHAAALDGAGAWSQFWTITFPLLSPTTFFLVVVNIINALFNTFGVIQTTTMGGPNNATNILVFKVYQDGFVNLNLGSSSAQSVILMVVVIILTVIQFRYIEKKVHY